MKYNVNDIVEVVDLEAFYYGALGRIDKIQPDNEYSYYVVFEMIDEYGETTTSSSRPLFNPSHGIPKALY